MDDIAKFLDEDEDETAHSPADVEAYAVGFGRLLEGDTSTLQQLCDRNAGSSATSDHAGNATSQSGQDIMSARDSSSHASSSIIASPHMTNSSQQPGTISQSKNMVPIARLVSIIQPQLDQDRALILPNLFWNLKRKEIHVDVFLQRMRSLVGDQMLRVALLNLKGEGATNSQIAALNQVQSAQLPTDVSISDNDAAKSREAEWEADLHIAQVGQMSTSSSGATIHGRNHPAYPAQGHNKQQHMQSTLGSFSTRVSTWRSRQLSTTTGAVPKNILAGNTTNMNPNIAALQNQAQRPSSTSEKQKTTVSPSMTHSSTRLHPLTTTVGTQNKSKAPPEKPPLAGQKKPMTAYCSLPTSSKKHKVSESLADQFQSIEHLNDVTAISGINLSEEEEQLYSGSKKDSRVSEAARQIEEKLILQKIPLQKKMIEIMAKSGLKNMTSWQLRSLEQCLSLAVEERMHRILSTAIKFSKQRVDMEKTRHGITVTSDVRKEVMAINRKAREEWEKKQAESEKSQKLKKVNMDEVNKMRAKAANVAAGVATGINDITSRWKLMIEAKQKEGRYHTSSGPHTNRDEGQKPLASSTNRSVGRKPLASSTTSTRDQAIKPPQVARTISVKDVLAVLEREPQMSKSALLYRLYLS
ncbi:transcription initiation factor TFIID subunit 4-like isoform X2 [Salvia splendens]|uniref:transcription initiation factor TFIID subunit 4-like isoform X2 n=1 Tax=Salvia splendens TaxID=180675 RepID=UPI001C27C17E|nr:transcription initiation factor TFIID subunit 4-like isoform X2 [Salvia splendens]